MSPAKDRKAPALLIAFVYALAAGGLFLCGSATVGAAENAVVIPPPRLDMAAGQQNGQVAVIAGGCFWGIQAVYQHTKGVFQAVSGYSGGTKQTASYEVVSSGRTGHAEFVQITFDPTEISYGEILQYLFLGRTRPDAAQPAGPGCRPAIPHGYFLCERRSEARGGGVHQTA